MSVLVPALLLRFNKFVDWSLSRYNGLLDRSSTLVVRWILTRDRVSSSLNCLYSVFNGILGTVLFARICGDPECSSWVNYHCARLFLVHTGKLKPLIMCPSQRWPMSEIAFCAQDNRVIQLTTYTCHQWHMSHAYALRTDELADNYLQTWAYFYACHL